MHHILSKQTLVHRATPGKSLSIPQVPLKKEGLVVVSRLVTSLLIPLSAQKKVKVFHNR